METNSSGEDLVVKVRKPYTITKQRERWTEDEHNRFLEAVKLYGRAWQRIEEHVGTKTAVQIRSHAQKFFTKLEKEAVTKGVAPGQAHDIDIPPPRPKRKPSCPYPRKSKGYSVNFQPLTVDFSKPKGLVSSLTTSRDTPHSEVDAFPEKNNLPERLQTKENSENGSCSEILTLFREVPCASISSVNETSPVKTGTGEKSHTEKTTNAVTNIEGNAPTNEANMNMEETETKVNPKPINTTNCVMSGIDGGKIAGFNINEKQPSNPANNHHCSNIPSSFLNYPGFSPFVQNCHCNNQDAAYRSFLNTSSTFSSLLMSTLLQNPAVHAAARLAASYWTPSLESEATNAMDSQNPNPSIAAIVAATVAAASAWWAAHGLLPIFPPIAVPFAPGPTNVTPELPTQNHQEDSVIPDLRKEAACDSDESAKGEKDSRPTILTNGSNKKKKQDPSSCGSNTPSSSDVETDNIPGKHEKAQPGGSGINEGPSENNNAAPSLEAELTNSRRSRSSSSANDSVSEEGRLAFQALFMREVLPQSFSPPQANDGKQGKDEECREKEKEEGEIEERDRIVVPAVDLNKNARVATDLLSPFLIDQGPDLHIKLKARKTGFKPYKRCSVEAKESRGTAGEEAGNKRLRLEGKAST